MKRRSEKFPILLPPKTQLLCYLRSIIVNFSFLRALLQSHYANYNNPLRSQLFLLSSLGYNFWLLETNLQFFTCYGSASSIARSYDRRISISHSITSDGLFDADFRRFACKFCEVARVGGVGYQLNLSAVNLISTLIHFLLVYMCGWGEPHEMENEWKIFEFFECSSHHSAASWIFPIESTIDFAENSLVELKKFHYSAANEAFECLSTMDE